MSAVYNYKWTCTGTTGTATTVCDKTYSNAATPVASNSAANAVNLYVAVSIWSLGTRQSSAAADNLFNDFAGSISGGTGTAQKNASPENGWR